MREEIVILLLQAMLCFLESEVCAAILFSLDLERRLEAAYDVSPASCNRMRSLVTLSTPSRRDSSDREMWPS